MRKYYYLDGFERIIEDGYITPSQMKADERIHGELVLMNDGRNMISPIMQRERGYKLWENTNFAG